MCGEEHRFLAVWKDGSRTSADAITDWGRDGSQPRLDGRRLLEGEPAIRWVRNTNQSVATAPTAFVEFVGGDCLPGRVIGYSDGRDDPADPQSAHLLVAEATEKTATGNASPPPDALRVTPTWLRRVVWQRSKTARYQPGTVFFRDGGQASFRAVRWTALGVRLLSDRGATLIAFDQIAELHLPRVDPWATHFDQLAVLSPTLEARLLHIETAAGLQATGSQQRFRARSGGDAADAQTWAYTIQPAWSLDALNVRFNEIRQWTWFDADEVPLTRIEPSACVQRSSLAGSWSAWQIDSNVQGSPLASGGRDYGWGFGVHAHNELEFSLPAGARRFSTRLALDHLSGSAGCVRARIVIDPSRESARYESPAIVGSLDEPRLAELEIPIQAANQGSRITLIADAAMTDFPPNADPLDIRDTFDWLEPLVTLDRKLIQSEIRARQPVAVSSQTAGNPPR